MKVFKLKKQNLCIEGCYLLSFPIHEDVRGKFIKPFISDQFQEWGLEIEIKEEFYTVSSKNVIRGMHFQAPPKAQKKIVQCLSGVVYDVVIDLRRNSSTYLKKEVITLNSADPKMLYLAPGIAHGFLSLTENSLIYYKVDQGYDSKLDIGILWDSIGIDWPVKEPILSDRDRKFKRLDEFITPFS